MIPECDYCDNTEGVTEIDNELLCPSCLSSRVNKSNINKVIDNGSNHHDESGPIQISEVMKEVKEVDNRVKIRTDLFNNATQSIVEIKTKIDQDELIEPDKKAYELAKILHDRFIHFKSVIFELNERVVEATNEQKAIQIYLNQLSNQLRVEEREKLKLQDINYKPTVKMPVTRKTIKKFNQNKVNKKELNEYADKLMKLTNSKESPAFLIQMMCIQSGKSVPEIYEILKSKLVNS